MQDAKKLVHHSQKICVLAAITATTMVKSVLVVSMQVSDLTMQKDFAENAIRKKSTTFVTIRV